MNNIASCVKHTETKPHRAEPSRSGAPSEYPSQARIIHQWTSSGLSTRNKTILSTCAVLVLNINHLAEIRIPLKIHNPAIMATNALLDSLRIANLLPSAVIPSTFTPAYHLTVKFPSLTPSDGSFARVSEVKDQPTISISAAGNSSSSTSSFTFLQIDPDAPTPADPKFGYWRHWVVTNIPYPSPSVPDANIVESGRTLTQYLAPGPKDDSGPHRYLFLLLQEPEGLKLEKSDVGGEEFVDRRSFRAEDWVAKHGLELVAVQWMRGVGDGWVEEGAEKQ